MNGKVTRITLDEALKVAATESLTDWKRLRAMTDAEIDAAIADDPDTYAIEDSEFTGRKGASFRYEIYRDSNGGWRWRLQSASGEILATSAKSYLSRKALDSDLTQIREALLGARSEAA